MASEKFATEESDCFLHLAYSARKLKDLCRAQELGIKERAGIGVNCNGLTDPVRGELVYAPAKGWRQIPVREYLPHPPIWFAGEYQLYFNLYSFQSEGVRPKCWGHAATGDFTCFRLLPCVLAPDQDYDRDGCASGCVAERDGILYAYYTGRNYYRLPGEVQCMAVRRDGNHFVKPRKNPILTPDSPDRNDYRDPAVFRFGERHIMLLGVKEEDGPALLAYSSGDMYSWTFESVFLSAIKELGSMWECPSFWRIGAADYLILSPEKIDGVDFYAAQFYDTLEGDGIWLKATGTDIVLERLEIAKMGKTPVEYQL